MLTLHDHQRPLVSTGTASQAPFKLFAAPAYGLNYGPVPPPSEAKQQDLPQIHITVRNDPLPKLYRSIIRSCKTCIQRLASNAEATVKHLKLADESNGEAQQTLQMSAMQAEPQARAEMVTGARQRKRLVETITRFSLWGDVVESGKAEQFPKVDPALHRTVVDLLVDCGQQLGILLDSWPVQESTEVAAKSSDRDACSGLEESLADAKIFLALSSEQDEARELDKRGSNGDFDQNEQPGTADDFIENLEASVGLLMDLLPSIEQIALGYGDSSSSGIVYPYSNVPTKEQMPARPDQHVYPLPGLPSMQQISRGGKSNIATQDYAAQPFDTTGQLAPPGMKPRVTATLWEDEGSLCFQVDAKGVCVARREDNNFINGTKLLNVAGMTRGRRDGILKSEKIRHVVKIGPMHLKGVWIPFERALEFANKEKITDILYPLFVHNIVEVLYQLEHPDKSRKTDTAADSTDRSRPPDAAQSSSGSAPLLTPASLLDTARRVRPAQSAQVVSAGQISSTPSASPGVTSDLAHTLPTPPVSGSGVRSPAAQIRRDATSQTNKLKSDEHEKNISTEAVKTESTLPEGLDGLKRVLPGPDTPESVSAVQRRR